MFNFLHHKPSHFRNQVGVFFVSVVVLHLFINSSCTLKGAAAAIDTGQQRGAAFKKQIWI